MSRTYSTHSISGRDFCQFHTPVGAYGLKNRVGGGALVWLLFPGQTAVKRGRGKARTITLSCGRAVASCSHATGER